MYGLEDTSLYYQAVPGETTLVLFLPLNKISGAVQKTVS
jgi:hypothetical protein